MATNALDVFKLTMAAIDELNEAGKADTSDTKEYKNRTIQIINILQGELYPYSDRYEAIAGKRAIAVPVINWEEEIVSLDDYICRSVLPYGLASRLLWDENPALANTCLQIYEDLKRSLDEGLTSASEDIEDLYGGIEYGEFSRW